MRGRSSTRYQPALETFEPRQLLSAGALANHGAAKTGQAHSLAASTDNSHSHLPTKFLAFRVTNTPFQTPYKLIPPFQQVLVQSAQPVPGQTYNVLQISVKNGTAQTITASNGFTVRLTTQTKSFPVLTGTQVWKPKQVIVFYVLTKKYYPLPVLSGGFQFDMGGGSSTLVPGPSGIFLRLKYNPATFARSLNWIVAYGQGNQVGKGAAYGLPNTSINEFVAASTRRPDFGGRY